MPTTDITRPTCCGPAVCASRLIPTGMIIPPPNPYRTRKKISELSDQAIPQSAELTPKTVMEIIQIRFEPKRSVIQPAKGMTTARESR
jgi:hypothetical protein